MALQDVYCSCGLGLMLNCRVLHCTQEGSKITVVVPTFGKTAASVSPCWLAAHAVSNYPMRTHHRVATPLALPGALEQYEDSLSGFCNEVLLVATCGMSCHVFKVWPRGA